MYNMGKQTNIHVARMDKLLKRRDFLAYMSQQQHMRELNIYEQRIRALEIARDALRDAPVRQLSRRKEAKSAATLCDANHWTDEDAAKFVEDFLQTHDMSVKSSTSGIASGLTKLGQALLMA